MLFIDNQGITDPRINLAIEEFVLRHLPMDGDSYLLFYINEPSIIIGKHQNTVEEINADYVKENGIHVVRRLSGGGAVYHDLGNLNFSFLTQDDGQSFHNFRKFTEPMVEALRDLGVEAQLSGRNDLQVGEQKISGNAQFSTRGRMFSHGTLMFDSELDNVHSALKANPEKFKSKSTKSVRSRVANISEFMNEPISLQDFKDSILRHIFKVEPNEVPQYKLTEEDWKKIHEISEERYRNWDWNYGQSPEYNVKHAKKFPVGIIDLRMDVKNGQIEDITIFGDFFGVGDASEVADLLRGKRYEESEIRTALEGVNLKHYFGNIEKDDFVGLVFLQD